MKPEQIKEAVLLPTAVVATTPAATLVAALRRMRADGIHHLVVIDHDQVVGIVSDRDILERGLDAEGRALDDSLKIGDVMTALPQCATETTTLAEALELMERFRITALPIEREGAVIGVLSESDLLRALSRHLAEVHAEQDATARSQIIMSNPLIQNAMNLLAQAGI